MNTCYNFCVAYLRAMPIYNCTLLRFRFGHFSYEIGEALVMSAQNKNLGPGIIYTHKLKFPQTFN